MFDYVGFASKIHKDDRYGQAPYTVHLSSVANMVGDDLKPLAWCHDLLEDHPECLTELRSHVDTKFLFQVLLITRRQNETYFEYINRIAGYGTHTPAHDVKVADLKFNLSQHPNPSLQKRYERALALLG